MLTAAHGTRELAERAMDLGAFAIVDKPVRADQSGQARLPRVWSPLPLAALIFPSRPVLWPLWIVGAVLLGIVVAKLFLVDLANTGTVERVVSFISVGVLVIVVGYFAPVPPKSQERHA